MILIRTCRRVEMEAERPVVRLFAVVQVRNYVSYL